MENMIRMFDPDKTGYVKFSELLLTFSMAMRGSGIKMYSAWEFSGISFPSTSTYVNNFKISVFALHLSVVFNVLSVMSTYPYVYLDLLTL